MISKNFKIYLRSSSKAKVDKEIQKDRNSEILKFEYLENEKSFLDEIKSMFHSFLKDYHLVEKQKTNTSLIIYKNKIFISFKAFKTLKTFSPDQGTAVLISEIFLVNTSCRHLESVQI